MNGERLGTLAVPDGVAVREANSKMTPEIKAACNLLATLHRDSGSNLTRISGTGGEFEIIVVTTAKAKVAITFEDSPRPQAARPLELTVSRCWRCGDTGPVADEFTSPHTGLCARCTADPATAEEIAEYNREQTNSPRPQAAQVSEV